VNVILDSTGRFIKERLELKGKWNRLLRFWLKTYNQKVMASGTNKTCPINTFLQKQFVKKPIFESLFGYLCKIKKFTGNEIVLEFGIGRFGFGKFYKEHFQQVYGVDIVDYSALHRGVEVLILKNGKIPLPDASVDLLVSHSVLEHVQDLDKVLSELNRVVKIGGTFFLTVSPLYYSGFGSHIYVNRKRLDNWQHLDPDSPYYLSVNPRDDEPGSDLNMLTSSFFLSSVGKQPWRIDRYETFFEGKKPPSYVNQERFSKVDLLTKEFRFIGTKMLMSLVTNE